MSDQTRTSTADASPPPTWAIVEIFGHRQHYGEIRDVEIAGGKLLEVRDIDTDKIHMYGAAAIFSLTPLTQSEMDEHVAITRRRKEEEDRWKRGREDRARARLAVPEADRDDDDENPF